MTMDFPVHTSSVDRGALSAAENGLVSVDSGATSSVGGLAGLDALADLMHQQTGLSPKIDPNVRVKYEFGKGHNQAHVSCASLPMPAPTWTF